jgi:hypothetical protein
VLPAKTKLVSCNAEAGDFRWPEPSGVSSGTRIHQRESSIAFANAITQGIIDTRVWREQKSKLYRSPGELVLRSTLTITYVYYSTGTKQFLAAPGDSALSTGMRVQLLSGMNYSPQFNS